MITLFLHLSQYAWMNVLVAYVVVPLELAIQLFITAFSCADIQWQGKRFGLAFAGMTLVRILHDVILPYGMVASTALRMVTGLALMLFIYLPPEKWSIRILLHLLAFILLNDIFTMICHSLIFPHGFDAPSMWIDVTIYTIPYGLLPNLICTILFAIGYRSVRRLHLWRSPVLFYVLAALATVIAVILPFLPLSNIVGLANPYYSADLMFFLTVLISGLLLLLVCFFSHSYLQYLQQLRSNKTLKQREQSYASIVGEQRTYRHNLMNMLYGLEGMILSGNMEKLQTYYNDEVLRKTRLINNENIISVQHLRSDSVRGLILSHIERAQEMGLAFHLSAKPLHSWCRVKDGDCCVLLGALLDNAREAALKAAAPLVFMEVRNEEAMLEVIIRNTFAEPPDIAAMQLDGYTTKMTGGGIGLLSVRKILSKYARAQLLTFVQGQYVVQQLLLP